MAGNPTPDTYHLAPRNKTWRTWHHAVCPECKRWKPFQSIGIARVVQDDWRRDGYEWVDALEVQVCRCLDTCDCAKVAVNT